LESITNEFIQNKSDEWLVDFYKLAGEHFGDRQILRRKPIIRLENGSQVAPCEAYLPSASSHQSKFKTIKATLVNDSTITFLRNNLGLKEPDELEEVKVFIIPKYEENLAITKEEYLSDFEFCYSIWATNQDKRQEIIDELKKINFLGCTDKESKFSLKRHNPIEGNPYGHPVSKIVYFRDNNLESWFDGNLESQGFFLILELGHEKYTEFLKLLGVQKSLFFDYNYCFKESSRGSHKEGDDDFNHKLNLQGLEFALDNITLSRSILLWLTICDFGKFSLFKGKIKTRKNKNDDWVKQDEQSSVLMTLMTEKSWLYDKDENLIQRSLSEISVDELHPKYNLTHKNVDKFIALLGLIYDSKQKELAQENQKLREENQRLNTQVMEADKRALESEKQAEELRKKVRELGINPDESELSDSSLTSDEAFIDDHNLPEMTIDDAPLKSIEPKDLSNKQFRQNYNTNSESSSRKK
ncbi:MAG: hypothetical protein ACK5CA_13650, partial [Cyanobacteriota bacterium]|jgi:hypothetical protein